MNDLNMKYIYYFYHIFHNIYIFLNILLNNFLLYKNHQYIYLFYHDKFHQYHKYHFQGNYHMIHYNTSQIMTLLNMKYMYYFCDMFYNLDINLNTILNNYVLYENYLYNQQNYQCMFHSHDRFHLQDIHRKELNNLYQIFYFLCKLNILQFYCIFHKIHL